MSVPKVQNQIIAIVMIRNNFSNLLLILRYKNLRISQTNENKIF